MRSRSCLANDEAFAFQNAQGLCEHLVRDPWHESVQLTKAARLNLEPVEADQIPLSSESAHRRCQRAAFGGRFNTVVRVAPRSHCHLAQSRVTKKCVLALNIKPHEYEVIWQAMTMIVEMRTYKLKPGTREHFLDLFRRFTMPEHARLGMPIIGPFRSIEDPDVFFFMRGFSNLESRELLKATFYEGALWKNDLEVQLMPMIKHYDVILVDDAEGLIRWG
jgi:hypothetical protein